MQTRRDFWKGHGDDLLSNKQSARMRNSLCSRLVIILLARKYLHISYTEGTRICLIKATPMI